MMYGCKYELSERLKVRGALSGTGHFIISFWTLVVHNSVVYAVLHVMRKMLGIICTFCSHLDEWMRRFLKIYNMLRKCKLNTNV